MSFNAVVFVFLVLLVLVVAAAFEISSSAPNPFFYAKNRSTVSQTSETAEDERSLTRCV